jgi:hypothetical protein
MRGHFTVSDSGWLFKNVPEMGGVSKCKLEKTRRIHNSLTIP